jgi:xylulokinase
MIKNFLLGIDIGSSSVKVSLLNADTGTLVSSASSPEQEMKMNAPRPGWAEQDPELWWHHAKIAAAKSIAGVPDEKYQIIGIGISYQMHGLVVVDKQHKVLHPAIIWCDSRAVEIGNKAFSDLGTQYSLGSCLNSPGNFTASKLKWLKDNKPEIYSKIDKIMLPGDYIAFKLTGEITTTITGLSEGILWDFSKRTIADRLIDYYGFDHSLIPELVPVFGLQGKLSPQAAAQLNLPAGIPLSYRAGDQPNNALSLNVLKPGEIASTAGTSGVIYGVTDKNIYDPQGRVNSFAHVNYSELKPLIGVLLCINGTGIQYSWLKQNILDNNYSYNELNEAAAGVEIGSNGILCFPYGNGAERSLGNKDIHASISGINFNIHEKKHLIRAAQEGIVYSFRYGFDIMKSIGMELNVIKAGNSNLFQSPVFKEAFVNTCNVDLEIYNTDGAQGAARGAGIGTRYFNSENDAFKGLNKIDEFHPETNKAGKYEQLYQDWKSKLMNYLA